MNIIELGPNKYPIFSTAGSVREKIASGAAYIGIDASVEAFEGFKRSDMLNLAVGDVANIPLQDGVADEIWIANVFGAYTNLPEKQTDGSLVYNMSLHKPFKEMARVLKAGGKMFIYEWNHPMRDPVNWLTGENYDEFGLEKKVYEGEDFETFLSSHGIRLDKEYRAANPFVIELTKIWNPVQEVDRWLDSDEVERFHKKLDKYLHLPSFDTVAELANEFMREWLEKYDIRHLNPQKYAAVKVNLVKAKLNNFGKAGDYRGVVQYAQEAIDYELPKIPQEDRLAARHKLLWYKGKALEFYAKKAQTTPEVKRSILMSAVDAYMDSDLSIGDRAIATTNIFDIMRCMETLQPDIIPLLRQMLSSKFTFVSDPTDAAILRDLFKKNGTPLARNLSGLNESDIPHTGNN